MKLYNLPRLALGGTAGVWISPEGEIEDLRFPALIDRVRAEPPLLVHRMATARRLGISPFEAWDLLELWAYVAPARFCLPTIRGLATALGFALPEQLEDQAAILPNLAMAMLEQFQPTDPKRAAAVAIGMARGGWPWTQLILDRLGIDPGDIRPILSGLDVWSSLPEWEETGPPPPPTHVPVEPQAARHRLAGLLAVDAGAEARPEQGDYTSAVSAAFDPREQAGSPVTVLAEAGTGVGKTLGYLSPATLWAEQNAGAVWVSTFTRNLQAQIEAELDRVYPDPAEKAVRVVVRKGRENYLCLLNFEDAARQSANRPGGPVALGLMARWIAATRDGALVGGDFPGWLGDLVGRANSAGLADRRGECVFSACPHYQKCFVERSVRSARKASIVIANHALVMTQVALGHVDEAYLPTRYVFDEGHHVFDAADSAFSALLSGRETVELRRWLLGGEGGSSRARGLRRRVEDLVAADEGAQEFLQDIAQAAAVLPAEGWLQRIAGGEPRHAIEGFLAAIRQQVLARAKDGESGYDLEVDKAPPLPGLIDAAARAERALAALQGPLAAFRARLASRLDDDAEDLETSQRLRIDAVLRGIDRRTIHELGAWRRMLKEIADPTPEAMVDWLSLSRSDGRESDYGLHRHWIDPTIPFAAAIAAPAHGLLMTSATLTDGTGDTERDWRIAESRTGATHFYAPAIRAKTPSPFDYAAQTRVFIVTDVRRDDLDRVAAAYRALFLAAGGGGLGLFTAIQRLRAVHERIAGPLDVAGLMLLAQHVDGLDIGTLIDIFRAEENACLLGTDAVRDGVDVPGRSLRLIVFDRVPWPRADILHRARRNAFGTKDFDDMQTRFRLRQAFGRLIRRADDRGVFVLLDPAMPSRLNGAFPPGTMPERVGLKDAIAATREFLSPPISGSVP